MMNDRFSAQLRQHLVDAANERPADGQLAAVLEHVDATGQRHPLAARLTWNPGRIAFFPSTALRLGLVVLALLVATAALAVLSGGTGPGRTVFEGTWTSIDPLDGSKQWLFVGPGRTPDVRYEDEVSTGGACIDDEVKHFIAVGSGEVTGSRLDVSFPDGGGCGLMIVSIPVLYYAYDPGTDTLVDHVVNTPSNDPEVVAGHMSAVWSRVTPGTPPARRPQATQPSATETLATEPPVTAPPLPEASPGQSPAAPTDAFACVDLANGGTYTAPVGLGAVPLTVTATVPENPVGSWQGTAGVFSLSTRCEGPAPITIVASTATDVIADSCLPYSPEIATLGDAVAMLDTATGDDISERVDLTIGGHPAARYDVVELSSCAGFGLWSGTILGPGETGSIYAIDVDGVLMAIELNRDGTQTQAELEEAWGIVESLQITR
jgi:hypothetical protein